LYQFVGGSTAIRKDTHNSQSFSNSIGHAVKFDEVGTHNVDAEVTTTRGKTNTGVSQPEGQGMLSKK
jgi:hypothetical protein